MKTALLGFTILLSVFVKASSDSYDLVYSILNTKCQNSGCHSNTSSQALKFDGSSAAVFTAITNVAPGNSSALAKGDMLVRRNQPYNSYLLRKCGWALDGDLSISAGEGDTMNTISGTPLSKKEVEYMRQWIMNGAAQTGTTIDTATINAYYNDPSPVAFLPKPNQPGSGKQLRFGPLFIAVNGEKEWLLKNEVDFPSDQEIREIDGAMNIQSHHFLLFRFQDSASAAAEPEGLRVVSLATGTTAFDGHKDLTGAWQGSNELHLPQGTALFWPKKTWLDFNYHSKNATGHVLPIDFYINITYVPHVASSTTIEMKSHLVNNSFFSIPANTVKTINFADDDNGTNETRYLWMMSSHTHKFGTGFNILSMDTMTSRDTLYRGTYNYEGGFELGYFPWQHPSVRFFEPQKPVNMMTGLFCSTTWNNTSSSAVNFGLTTSNEMQLFYYMYTKQLPATPNGIAETGVDMELSVVPNPFSGQGNLLYELQEATNVRITISDITGKQLFTMDEKQPAGAHTLRLNENGNLSTGIYFAQVNTNGKRIVQKFAVAK